MSLRRALFAVAVMVLPSAAGAQAAPDPDRGRALYESHCIVCHTSKVHRRFPPAAIDREALRFIVRVWVEEQKLRWSNEEIEDVVYYLDRTHYRFGN